MSKEERIAIVREYVPQLVKLLTGFEETDKNLRRCEQYALTLVDNHRYLNTSSHEVRRKIEGMQEKFRVSNYPDHALYLGRCCELIVKHPLCVNHYELDVHWSLIDFVLTLAYDPIRAMRQNRHKIDPHDIVEEDECSQRLQEQKDFWANELKDSECAEVLSSRDTDSELSEWSEDDSDEPSNAGRESSQSLAEEGAALPEDTSQVAKSVVLQSFLPSLKPPQKSEPFVPYNGSKAEDVLRRNVQHSWWLAQKSAEPYYAESPLPQANFATTYACYLSEYTNNLIPYKQPVLISEHGLLREILWMFHQPVTCTAFEVTPDGIRVRDNVTLPSVSAGGMHHFLQTNILPYIEQMATLKTFIAAAYKGDEFPPKTVECYAANLRSMIEPLWNKILEYEAELIEPPVNEARTVVHLVGHFRVTRVFEHLECLHDIHQQVTLKLRECAPHIICAYLLTGLIKCHRHASKPLESNIALALFLTTVKNYCAIIHTWWTEGRLDDYQKEFMIEHTASDHNVRLRLFESDKDNNVYVPQRVTQCITRDRFFTMLKDHLLEAGFTFNLLYELGRISELRVAANATHDTGHGHLYDSFLKEVMSVVETDAEVKASAQDPGEESQIPLEKEEEENIELPAKDSQSMLAKLCTPKPTQIVDSTDGPAGSEDERCDSGFPADSSGSLDEELCIGDSLKNLTTTDKFLLMAFTNYLKTNDSDDDEESDDGAEGRAICGDTVDAATTTKKPNVAPYMTALDIFEALQRSKRMLPMEEVILATISRLLKTRIDFADAFVIQLYRDEFNILSHLRNLRKVLLLEASDLMHAFYCKLFQRIQADKNWASPARLTSNFDDMLSVNYPHMSSKFNFVITPIGSQQTNKVFKGIDELSIQYLLEPGLEYMITPPTLLDYNRVFRFLLKVKWSMWTIEKLPFPKIHRHQLAYAPYEMIDFLARRLQQIRFWMLYALQNIHFHLMTHVLQSMGEQLDERIVKCRTFKEMNAVHQSYLRTVCEHCFLEEDLSAIKLGVDMLMNLVFVLRFEWYSCLNFIADNNPLAISLDDASSSALDPDNDYVQHNQIDAIESTYVRCHSYLATKLNHEVYVKKKSFLSGLSAAFSTSMPY